MSVKVMTLVSVNEEEPFALAQYLDLAGPIFERAGGQMLQRFKIIEVGKASPRKQTLMLMEYPSIEAANSLFESADFELMAPIRKLAFRRHKVAVASN